MQWCLFKIKLAKGTDQGLFPLSWEGAEWQQVMMLLSFSSGPDMLRYLGRKVASYCGFVLAAKPCAWHGTGGRAMVSSSDKQRQWQISWRVLFSISAVSFKWRNGPAAGPGFTLAAYK